MEKLPQELVDRISFFLPEDDQKQTLFVSRKFWLAAEQYSDAFSDFAFNNEGSACSELVRYCDRAESIRGDAQKFIQTYSGRRFRYLRYIEVHTGFPPLGLVYRKDQFFPKKEDVPCRETLDELKEKDEIFTEQIRGAIEAIKVVEEKSGKMYGPGKIQLTILTPLRHVDNEYCHRVYSAWRVHLLSPKTFPQLQSVRGLSVCNPEWISSYRRGNVARSRLDPRVLIDLAKSCPNLEFLGCELGTEEWPLTEEDPARQHFKFDFEGCKKDARHDFAKALDTAAMPKSLRHVQLDFMLGCELREQEKQLPDIVAPYPYDIFSSSLRVLASQLRVMQIRVVADETLFWPSDGTVACFPILESVDISFNPFSPSGSWYFHGPMAEGRDDIGYNVTETMYPPLEDHKNDDDRWHRERVLGGISAYRSQMRIVPNERTIVPFLSAFAKAAANMHALKDAILWAPLVYNPIGIEDSYLEANLYTRGLTHNWGDVVWCIAYCRPGEPALLVKPGMDKCVARQIWWKVGRWRPNAALHDVFQNIGKVDYGEEVIEHWHDETTECDLVEREWITEGRIAQRPGVIVKHPKWCCTYPNMWNSPWKPSG